MHISKYITSALSMFLFSTLSLPAQQLLFRGQKVNEIKIISDEGVYNFKKRALTGIADTFSIKFDSANDNYFISKYIKLSIYQGVDKDTIERIHIKKLKHFHQIIERKMLDTLLQAFNHSIFPIDFNSLEISKGHFLELVKKEKIIKIAKLYEEDWRFKRKYSEEEDNNNFFKGLQSVDTLNLFLKAKFDTTCCMMVTDVWNVTTIHICAGNKVFSFESKYPYPFRQPWFELPDGFGSKAILNPEINRQLLKILPEYFITRSNIDYHYIMNSYILWYLRRRGIVSRCFAPD